LAPLPRSVSRRRGPVADGRGILRGKERMLSNSSTSHRGIAPPLTRVIAEIETRPTVYEGSYGPGRMAKICAVLRREAADG